MIRYRHTADSVRQAIIILTLIIVSCAPAYAQNSGKRPGVRTVVIDPGHGGKDPGALGQTVKTHEAHIVLSVAKQFGEMIKKAYPDVKVVYTRETDDFIGLHERAMIARRNKADLFISLHCNSSKSQSACGSSVHILGKKSKNANNKTDYFERSLSVAQRENGVIVLEDGYETKYKSIDPDSPESVISGTFQWTAFYQNSLSFASEVVEKLIRQPLTRRTLVIDQDVFQVLVEANMPAVLIELAFISNPSEYKYLASASGQKEIAGRLLEAFKAYKTYIDVSVGSGNTMQTFASAVSETEQQADTVSGQDTSDAEEYYGIQIMGLGRLLKKGDSALKGLEAAAIKVPGKNMYKYVTGKYSTKQQADAALKQVRAKFSEAFVVKVEGDTVSRP